MDDEGRSQTAKQVAPDASPRLPQRASSLETVLFAGGVALFLALLYSMARASSESTFLSPAMIALALAVLVWPIRHAAAPRSLLLAMAVVLGVWLLSVLSGVLAPFVVMYILAFVFDPLVTRARERFNIPRFVTSLVLTLMFVGALVLVLLLLIPRLFAELEDLAVGILGSVGHVREWIMTTTLLDDLEAAGLINKQELLRNLTSTIQQRVASLTDSIPLVAQSLIRYVTSLFGVVTIVAILPVILYYTLKDYPFIKRRLVELFPTFGGQHDYLVEAGAVVGSYLRGQLTISAIAAFNVSVLLSIFNVPYALIIGLLTGVLNLIPNLGAIITNVIAVIMMLVFGREPWYRDVIIVLGVLGGQSLLEQSLLTPKILSHSVGLHPVLIILSLFVFAHFLGWLGFIIAVPTTALIMTFYKSRRDGWNYDVPRPRARGSGRGWRRRLRLRDGSTPPTADDEAGNPPGDIDEDH